MYLELHSLGYSLEDFVTVERTWNGSPIRLGGLVQ